MTASTAIVHASRSPPPLALLLLGRGTRPGLRAGRRLPRRRCPPPPTRPGRARPRRQGRARRPRLRARPPLPARRGHPVRRRDRRLVQARPAGRGPARARSTSSSAACTSWPRARTSSPPTHQQVVLPDLAAGCSMADMAAIDQVEDAWDVLRRRSGVADVDRPGHVHELLRRDQGLHRPQRRHGLHVVQRQAARWSGPSERGASARCSSCPTSTSAATPRCCELGLSLDDCVLFDPHKPGGGLTAEQLRDAQMILWRGHCSVHGRFTEAVGRRGARARSPASRCWCTRSAGTRWSPRPTTSGRPSTSSSTLDAAPAGSAWAVGTELNLVRRLASAHPDKQITLPGPHRLLLLDDEPDRPAAPGVGAGVAGRRASGQPDHVDPDTAHGPGRARPDARAARRHVQGLMTATRPGGRRLRRPRQPHRIPSGPRGHRRPGHRPDRQPGRRRGQGSARSRVRPADPGTGDRDGPGQLGGVPQHRRRRSGGVVVGPAGPRPADLGRCPALPPRPRPQRAEGPDAPRVAPGSLQPGVLPPQPGGLPSGCSSTPSTPATVRNRPASSTATSTAPTSRATTTRRSSTSAASGTRWTPPPPPTSSSRGRRLAGSRAVRHPVRAGAVRHRGGDRRRVRFRDARGTGVCDRAADRPLPG